MGCPFCCRSLMCQPFFSLLSITYCYVLLQAIVLSCFPTQLLFGRVPSCVDPQCTNLNHLPPVHLQCVDRRVANVRQANDCRAVDTPVKVIEPSVLLRMKETRRNTRKSIARCAIRFEPIACWTSEAEIFKFCCAVRRSRDDMFNFEDSDGQRFIRLAISTTIGKSFSYSPSQLDRNIFTHEPLVSS